MTKLLRDIFNMKEQCQNEIFCGALAGFGSEVLQYVRSLRYGEMPDYDLIRSKIEEARLHLIQLEDSFSEYFYLVG